MLGYLALNAAIAFSHGVSERSNAARFAWKYALCAGTSSDRSAAMTLATAGIVLGSYHRCGFGVLSGRPSTSWATITLRLLFGDAASILLIQESYPTPFCTISDAPLTSWATAGLASNVCGSVFGLLRIEDTCTYRPPICARTLAYSFSAPMALITVVESAEVAPVGLLPHPAAVTASAAAAPARITPVLLPGNLRAADRPAVLTIRGNIV